MKLSLALLVVLAVWKAPEVKCLPTGGLKNELVDFTEEINDISDVSFDEEYKDPLAFHVSRSLITESGTLTSRSLKNDLDDFLKLIPLKKIEDLFLQYLAEDEDFGETIDYLLSEEFKELVIEVEGMIEVRDLLQYLQDSGLDAYNLVNRINDLLGIEHIKPLTLRSEVKIGGGLSGFIDDVKALIPVKEIEKLYKEKLVSSQDFAKLIQRLQSKEFQEFVNKLMANPKIEKIIKRAEGKGVDVQAILDLITSVLGLKFPSRPPVAAPYLLRSLQQDIDDFIKLIPKSQIEELFFRYLAEDEDFGEAIDYVLSDEFKSLVVEVESATEVRSLLNYLQESGLDAYGELNKLNDLLGIKRITPTTTTLYDAEYITGGLPGFIKDVTALLPIKEIEKLYNEKLKNSKDFNALIKRLQSQEFQGLVDKIMANPRLQNLIKRAEAKGVDVQAILDLITSVLGLKFPSTKPPTPFLTKSLGDDLDSFFELLPIHKIEKLSSSKRFQEFIHLLETHELKGIVNALSKHEGLNVLFNMLEALGVDLKQLAEIVKGVIGKIVTEKPTY